MNMLGIFYKRFGNFLTYCKGPFLSNTNLDEAPALLLRSDMVLSPIFLRIRLRLQIIDG